MFIQQSVCCNTVFLPSLVAPLGKISAFSRALKFLLLQRFCYFIQPAAITITVENVFPKQAFYFTSRFLSTLCLLHVSFCNLTFSAQIPLKHLYVWKVKLCNFICGALLFQLVYLILPSYGKHNICWTLAVKGCWTPAVHQTKQH